jgi:hypothetical protein
LKSVEYCTLNNLTNIHVMTFNVHLAQFDITPTRTRAGISLLCDYLINELNKKMTMMTMMLYGSMKMMLTQ